MKSSMHISASVVVYLFTVVSFLVGIAVYLNPNSTGYIKKTNDESGAISGRFVSIPAKDYINIFKTPIKLGQCPLILKDGSFKTCKDEFEGEIVHLTTGVSTVDDSTVQNAADILLHCKDRMGAGVGVLGLVDVDPKLKVFVTTDSGKKVLNLLRSYKITKGIKTLHMPRPKLVEGDKALFLSEIEFGGDEMLLVTLEFESVEKKTEVESSVSLKNIFISISPKLEYIENAFQFKASRRIQFISSWRDESDEYHSELSKCIPRVKEIEELYTKGTQELQDMSFENEKLHYFYYLSSWNASPYGTQANFALINHDLEFLSEKNLEVRSVIAKINKLNHQFLPAAVKSKLLQLNTTLTDITQRITYGIKEYHNLQPHAREQLRDIYGKNKAPMYYDRLLEKILSANFS